LTDRNLFAMFLRFATFSLLEKVSGVVTGSDTRPDRTLSKALSHQYNLVGEGVTSKSMVDIVKTHCELGSLELCVI